MDIEFTYNKNDGLILECASVLNQVLSKATVFHKITIYFGMSHTFISGYIYITLKQKVEKKLKIYV